MAFAVSTASQGGSVFLTMPGCSINAYPNTDVSGIEFDIKPITGNASGFFNIAGVSTTNVTALRIEVATGILQWRYSGTVYLSSAAGVATMGERAKYGAEWDELTASLYLTKNGERIAGPYATTANAISTNIIWNQIGRVGTSSPSPQAFELYGVRTYGGNATYQTQWGDTGASGDGVNWADDTATRNITIVGYTGAANSWWLFYNSTGNEVTGTFSASAVAGASMPGTKIALGTYAASAVINAAVSGSKLAAGGFSAGATVAASIAGTKIAGATFQAAANVFFGIAATTKIAKGSFNATAIASAYLQGGNNLTVGGTFTASAVAGASMPGSKVVFGTFAASAVANASATGSKRAGGTFNSRANASAAASGSKIASATFVATAHVRATMYGYNASIQMPVTEWTIFTNSQQAFELSTTSEPSATLVTLSQQEFSIHTNS